MSNHALVVTRDGSHTLYDQKLKSHFHSMHGAIRESDHIFIKNGLHYIHQQKSEVKIFEFGFGTGLNAYLTYLYSKNYRISIDYAAVEAYPIEWSLIQQLNYPNLLTEDEEQQKPFYLMHNSDWGQRIEFNTSFQFIKHHSHWMQFEMKDSYDLIYFDAFDPRVQPELWMNHSLMKLYDCMNLNAILTTYCAQGHFKRNLKHIGFEVEVLQGPPGKREMIRAIKV
jgi:tRNA U34 5-methylaminomethyl-2-thiouridine-forming methyltransferase MnmC